MIWGGPRAKLRKKITAAPARKIELTSRLPRKKDWWAGWPRKKIIMHFMMGCDALNIDKHGFSMQFRYKSLIIYRSPLESCRGKKYWSAGWPGKKLISWLARKKTHCEFSARGPAHIINDPSLNKTETLCPVYTLSAKKLNQNRESLSNRFCGKRKVELPLLLF